MKYLIVSMLLAGMVLLNYGCKCSNKDVYDYGTVKVPANGWLPFKEFDTLIYADSIGNELHFYSTNFEYQYESTSGGYMTGCDTWIANIESKEMRFSTLDSNLQLHFWASTYIDDEVADHHKEVIITLSDKINDSQIHFEEGYQKDNSDYIFTYIRGDKELTSYVSSDSMELYCTKEIGVIGFKDGNGKLWVLK